MLELLVAATLVTVVMGSVVLAMSSTAGSFEVGSTRSTLQAKVNRVVDRMTSELSAAGLDSLAGLPTTPFFDDSVTFDRLASVSMADGSITWNTVAIEFEYEPAEADDGVDNDNDGLIDEGRVVLVRAPGTADEQRIVLCTGVAELQEGEFANLNDDNGNGLDDEGGLCFTFSGTRMTILLTLQAIDGQGRLVERSLNTSIFLRN